MAYVQKKKTIYIILNTLYPWIIWWQRHAVDMFYFCRENWEGASHTKNASRSKRQKIKLKHIYVLEWCSKRSCLNRRKGNELSTFQN